jgi:predicted Rossmann fold nucleotide-binding protein DprA/Smf involved in DNA uptake
MLEMQLTPQAQAIMLLTVSFGQTNQQDIKPLSNGEWARFAGWLKDRGLEPASLLSGNLDSLLDGWVDRAISFSRIQGLLRRGTALGLVVERWERAGIWILTRSDPSYPERIKRHLRLNSPAILFGCGNRDLLNEGGVAVVGSRDASEEDLAFAETLGRDAAHQGHTIVSGDARGIDQRSMSGALECGGNAVGVVADNLVRSATAAAYRKRIMSGRLTLISPFNPEVAFNVGNAMARNRYIYCMADSAVVVSCTPDKGGTWNGALENLKAAWVPLWVKRTNAGESGNAELVRRGAQWLPDMVTSLDTLQVYSPRIVDRDEPSELTTSFPSTHAPKAPEANRQPTAPARPSVQPDTSGTASASAGVSSAGGSSPHTAAADFYGLFTAKLIAITAAAPMTTDEIGACMGLEKSQVNAWLRRAVSERKAKKFSKPVRYQSTEEDTKQASLFGDDMLKTGMISRG